MRLGLLVFCISVSASFAQVKPSVFDPLKPLTQSAIDQWTSERGLYTNNLTSVVQARTGFLWITTYNGLIRFDGHSFELFDRDLIPFLRSDAFYRGYEDKNGTLWFATQGSGIVKFEDGQFKSFLPTNAQLPKSIRCLLFSESGEIWAGSNNNGLFLIRDSAVTLPPYEAVREVSILSIAQDRDHNVWVATNGNGILKISPDKKVKQYTVEDGLLSNVVNTIRCTPEGEVIAGTSEGLNFIDQGKVSVSNVLNDTGIISLALDDFGSIWLATENGLARINRAHQVTEIVSPQHGLPTLEITSLLFDREGSLWLTSSKGGLIRLKDTGINTYNRIHGLSSDLINIVAESADGKIYTGTDGGEIDILVRGKATPLKLENSLQGVSIRDLCFDKDGTLWIASYGGLIKKTANKETLFNVANRLPVQDARRVFVDKHGDLWLGTRSGGVFKLKNDQVVETYNRKNGLASNYVLAVEEDARGNIYVGTNGGGLSRIDNKGTVTTFHFSEDDSGILIFNVHIDDSGAIWVVTNNGLYYFNGSDFKKLLMDHPTKGETYFDWIEDDVGNVWV
ncbi:MAG: ligand-binding sensor domain-containing protein, partial [Bacteroidota bacterium]